ncbi:transposase [Solibacillus sp. FSL R7-0682]|uniref:transposase n=1 Tax=Solibacillus sp. FSL R7-0682 TaxID=2921690 RepID=UPI0040408697
MEKQKIYVSVANLTCNFYPGPSYEFVLHMDPIKARVFSKLFSQMNRLEASNAFRAHMPFIPYHMDQLNHDLDNRLQKLYALIHEFGDEEAKKFVEQLPFFRKRAYF